MAGYWQNLEARNYVSGGTINFSMDGLQAGTRVRTLSLSFDLVGTKNAADTLSGDLFARLVSNLKLGNFFNMNGTDLSRLMWNINGHVVEDPVLNYSINNTSATTFQMYFTLDIPLRDQRTGASDDGSFPVELLASRGIELTLAAANVWGVGALTITGGVVRCAVERIHETNIPFLSRYGYLDASSQTVRLEAGLYKDLIITKADGTLIQPADITTIDLVADGRPVLQAMRYEQLVTAWNRTAQRNGPAGARAELANKYSPVPGVPFLPLIWHDNSGQSRITKQMLVQKDGLLQITSGGLTNPRLVFWKGVAKDKETIAGIAKAIGAPPDATTYEPAVASKTQPHATATSNKTKVSAIYSFLGGKFRSRPSPGNKVAGT